MTRPIDDVYLVALLEQDGGPASSSVWRAHPVETLTAAAVHEHDGIRVLHHRGDLILDVHLLPVGHGAARQLGALHAHEEVAPFRDIEWRAGTACGHLCHELGRIDQVRAQPCAAHARSRRALHELAPADPSIEVAAVQILHALLLRLRHMRSR